MKNLETKGDFKKMLSNKTMNCLTYPNLILKWSNVVTGQT